MLEIIKYRLYGIKLLTFILLVVVNSFNLEIEVLNNNQGNNIDINNPFDSDRVFDTISQFMFSNFN